MIPVVSRRNRRNTVGKVGSKYYWLYDQFTTDRAAGAVNGTSAEPVGGARTLTDTNNKYSISGGKLVIATGQAANDAIRWPVQSKVLGKTLISEVTMTAGACSFGWDFNTTGAANEALTFNTGGTIIVSNNGNTTNKTVGTFTYGQTYKVANVMRSLQTFHFITGGTEYPQWQMVQAFGTTNIGAALYPTIVTTGTAGDLTVDNVRIPRQLFVPIPLQSDGFSTTTTDGQGNQEANGPVGNTYTDIGTWDISGGVAKATALSGAFAARLLNCSSPDVIIEVDITRAAVSQVGIVARYQDANNFLNVIFNGTNIVMYEVIAGVATQLRSQAVTYSAGTPIKLILSGTTAHIMYNSGGSPSAITLTATGNNSTLHGIYTSEINTATFDNLTIFARGTSGEYAFLDTV